MRRTPSLLCVMVILSTSVLHAADKLADHNAAVEKAIAPAAKLPGVIKSYIGVTRLGTRIPCLVTRDDADYGTKKQRILLIGGLGGTKQSVESILAVMEWFYSSKEAAELRKTFALSAVPIANPDAWATGRGPGNLSGGMPAKTFPPKGPFYSTKTDPEAAYLWRWIGMHAPDVIDILPREHAFALSSVGLREMIAGVGSVQRISGMALRKPKDFLKDYRGDLQLNKSIIDRNGFEPGTGRILLQRRIARTPTQIAKLLAKKYGHDLRSVAYIPALALIGRMRLGELTGDDSHRKDVEKIVAPYFSGKKPTYTRINGSMMPGHLVFGELALATKNPAKRKPYIALVKRAADLGFDEDGKPKQSMPAHSEMSDAVFMGCPILVQAGKLTGERKYFDMAVRHLRFMQKLDLRRDGLYRHSPLDETAWGRGNGFPALSLALCLADFPQDHPGYKEMLGAFQRHMAAMAKHQDYTGTWHQVVDRPESYREFTVTCMTTFAMIRGIRNGWLDEKTYTPIVNRAWTAIKTRIAPDATLVDVCTGTGKQKNLRAYYDRTAILGHDARGGAMALLVTTEMARWKKR